MKQMTFADAEYAGKRKQTRKELFLIEMGRVVPWKGLIALIEPHYPKGEGGRPAYPLMAMLHGEENVICADAGYTGVEKRAEHDGREVIWQVAARRSTYKKLGKSSLLYEAKRKIEKT